MFRTDLFVGKRFLVTGGGTGLGRIMMERFVELGADCVICGRRGGVLEETAREVMGLHPGRRVDTFTVDIRVASAVEEMIDRIWAGGPLDGLVNNAAGNFISPTKDLSPRAFDAIANIVLHGTFYMTNACGGAGSPSAQGERDQHPHDVGVDGQSFVVPSAIQSGCRGDDQSLAVEGDATASAHAIAPGPFRPRAPGRLNPMKEGDDDHYKVRNPMGRVGRRTNSPTWPRSDVRRVAYINGEIIAIDGGMGIMGNGTFANMMAYSEDDWRRIREQIQSTNATDRVRRS